jgi:hypothetical protein
MKQIGPVIVMDPWEAHVAGKVIREAFREGLIREQQKKKGSWHFTCSDVEAAEEVARRIGEHLASISEAA